MLLQAKCHTGAEPQSRGARVAKAAVKLLVQSLLKSLVGLVDGCRTADVPEVEFLGCGALLCKLLSTFVELRGSTAWFDRNRGKSRRKARAKGIGEAVRRQHPFHCSDEDLLQLIGELPKAVDCAKAADSGRD